MTNFQTGAVVGLRLLIGWHFLYEGLAKLANPYWTSAGYLAESQWIFQDLLVRIAASPTAVTIVDYMNMWGLTLIGLGLLLGLFTRTAAVAGIVLLVFYFVSAPPFTGLSYPMPLEGSYLIVNKVLIEDDLKWPGSRVRALPKSVLDPLGKNGPWIWKSPSNRRPNCQPEHIVRSGVGFDLGPTASYPRTG
jgi:thiosulfate dehydrogenase (quinone) large subunit